MCCPIILLSSGCNKKFHYLDVNIKDYFYWWIEYYKQTVSLGKDVVTKILQRKGLGFYFISFVQVRSVLGFFDSSLSLSLQIVHLYVACWVVIIIFTEHTWKSLITQFEKATSKGHISKHVVNYPRSQIKCYQFNISRVCLIPQVMKLKDVINVTTNSV